MLKGTLDDFTLPDVFRMMSSAKKTGRLDVVRSAGRGTVFFRDGDVYYADSSVAREPLGQKLIKAGVLKESLLMKALDEHASSGVRVGEVLIEMGAVSTEQLERAVKEQIEDAVFDLLRWDLGEFSWESGIIADVEVPIQVSGENLIMEASRKLDELEVILRKIPSEYALLAMAPTPPEGAVEINITPDEWRLLVLVNGQRSVHDIASMVGMDALSAMQSFYGLVSTGLVEVVAEHFDQGSRATIEVAPESAAVPATVQEEQAAVQEEPAAVEPAVHEDLGSPAVPAASDQPKFEPSNGAVEDPAFDPAEILADPRPEELLDEPPRGGQFEDLDLGAFAQSLESGLEEVPEAPPAPAAPWAEPAAAEAILDEAQAFEVGSEPVALEAPPSEELLAETPSEDSFLRDILDVPAPPPVVPAGDPEPPWMPDAPVVPGIPAEAPVTEAPSSPEPPTPFEPSAEGDVAEAGPEVDRAAVVRELAGLFDDDFEERSRHTRLPKAAATEAGEDDGGIDGRKRVEDDDQVTRGLISRLIDGVKGL